MIETIINEPLALPSNASPITFDETDIRTRCASCCGWLDYSNGNPNFKIFGNGYTGYYDVEFSASVSTATPGVVAVALFQDGVIIPDTIRAVTIAAADDYETISFDKKLRVLLFNEIEKIEVETIHVENITTWDNVKVDAFK